MNIGIDMTSLIYERGVSRYTANLVRALTKNKKINLFLYGSSLRQNKILKNKIKNICQNNKSCVYKIQNYPPSLLAKLWALGLNPVQKIFSQKLDLFHSWDYLQPPDKNLPLVSTIHDLALLKYPETAHPKILAAHKKAWKILKQKKAEIIAPSKATQQEIIKYLDIKASKIHVTYEALPVESKQIAENLSESKYNLIKNKLNLNKKFLLFVGTTEPRKNLARLIKAWDKFSADYDLIIAGASGWDNLNIKTQKRPRFLGYVTPEQLVVLYSEASIFCYPSLDEGFGLPILEAFYFGTPVITSNTGATKEIAGNAAELVNSQSVDDIKNKINKILAEKKNKQKQRLQKMLIRSQLFDWDQVARKTIQAYQAAINNYAN